MCHVLGPYEEQSNCEDVSRAELPQPVTIQLTVAPPLRNELYLTVNVEIDQNKDMEAYTSLTRI